jgi:hypothetical protein
VTIPKKNDSQRLPFIRPRRRAIHGFFERIKDKDRFFWILNLGYWSFYWMFLCVVHASVAGFKPEMILWHTLIATLGFLSGLWMRLVYRRIPIETLRLAPLFWIVLAITAAGGNLWYFADWGLDRLLQGAGRAHSITLSGYLTYTFYYDLLLFGWSLLFFVTRFWILFAEQRERAKKADLLDRQSQLQMLRYQLNPHFLFNALNSARALVDENEGQAKAMITELSEFLRYTLIGRNERNIPLNREMDAIRHYFSIEKKRYEDKLRVTFNIDPSAEDYPVIPFLVHPLVENAVKYGMKTSAMPLCIVVDAAVSEGSLKVGVFNTGRWIEPSGRDETIGTGTGLKNVRKRLENAFPEHHRFSVDREEEGVRVRIELFNRAVISHLGAVHDRM